MRLHRGAAYAGAALLLVLGFVLGPRACRRGGDAPRTLVLLTIDTWRADHAGFLLPGWPDGPSRTPHLDGPARAALRFEDARSPVPLTLPAHTTMLTGLPPAATGVWVNAYGRLPTADARGFPLLAERLSAEGWRTGAFVSAETLARTHGLDQGFEVYDDERDEAGPALPGSVRERAGAATVARARAWLATLPRDAHAFLWVHLFEPHGPYGPRGYAGDVEDADAAAGLLLDALAAVDRADAALLVTSDHGEMLGDLREPTHGHLLGDAVLHVPLLLRVPGRAAALRRDPVDLADVAPTLAALAGVDWPAAGVPFAGQDLLAGEAPPDRVRVAETRHAQQRFRWAQIVAATDAGGTLVDVGQDRVGWLPRARPGEVQATLERRRAAPPQALVDAIGAYKRADQPQRNLTGATSGGYGAPNAAAPFFSPEANGLLPDPYEVIERAEALDQARWSLLFLITAMSADPPQGQPRVLAEREATARHLVAIDPGNPEAHFVLGLAGEARAIQAERGATPPDPQAAEALRTLAADARAEAEAEIGRAFALGRADAATLYRWCGVNRQGRERVCLERLLREGRAPTVTWDASLWVRAAELHRALGEEAQALEACRKAREAARDAKEKAIVERRCAVGTALPPGTPGGPGGALPGRPR